MSFGIGAVFSGIGQGLANWEREERQIRRENARAFQEYVAFAKENGLDPDPTELSKAAEQITGGSNWQMAALPSAEVRQQISTRLTEARKQRRTQEQLNILQAQQAEENIFGSMVNDTFLNGGTVQDIDATIKKRFGDAPEMMERANRWMTGQNLDQRRATVLNQKASELARTITEADTEESVRRRFNGMAPELVEQLAIVARQNQAKIGEERTQRAMQFIASNGAAFAGPNGGVDLSSAVSMLRQMFGDRIDVERLAPLAVGAGRAAALNFEQQRQSIDLARRTANRVEFAAFQQDVLRDPQLAQEVISNEGNFSPETTERLRRIAKDRYNIDFTDGDLAAFRNGVLAQRFEQLQVANVQMRERARTEGEKEFDDRQRTVSATINDTLAPKAKDNLTKNALAEIARRFHTTDPAQLSLIGATLKTARDEMGSSANPVDLANNVTAKLAQMGVPTTEAARTSFVTSRIRQLAGPAPEPFDIYYARNSREQSTRISTDFGQPITQATSVEEWMRLRDRALQGANSALRGYEEEARLASRGNYLGFDRQRFDGLREQMQRYRDQLQTMQPPPGMPATRADYNRQLGRQEQPGQQPPAPAASSQFRPETEQAPPTQGRLPVMRDMRPTESEAFKSAVSEIRLQMMQNPRMTPDQAIDLVAGLYGLDKAALRQAMQQGR